MGKTKTKNSFAATDKLINDMVGACEKMKAQVYARADSARKKLAGLIIAGLVSTDKAGALGNVLGQIEYSIEHVNDSMSKLEEALNDATFNGDTKLCEIAGAYRRIMDEYREFDRVDQHIESFSQRDEDDDDPEW